MKLKKKKHKFINGTRGAISILLCIIISPFLTIASSLVEFARYQGTVENLGEIMDCAAFSTLANYDTYLQERFGLFAVSQECDISDTYNQSVLGMTSLLGKSVSFESNTATGKISLSKDYAMKSQILDFSETTVMTEVLLDDMNIEDLIAKLKTLEVFNKVTSAVETVADVAESLGKVVEQCEEFAQNLEDIQSEISDIQTEITTLETSITELCKELSENYIYDEENVEESLETLVDTYLNDITDIYTSAENIYDSIDELCTKIEELPTTAENLKTAIGDVSKKLEKISTTTEEVSKEVTSAQSEQGENKKEKKEEKEEKEAENTLTDSADATTAVIAAVITELDKAFTEAVEKFKEDTIESVKKELETFKTTLKQSFKLDKYSSNYFNVPLSDEAKEDLIQIISIVPEAWEEGSADVILEKIKEIYLPETIDLQSFSTTISNVESVIDKALKKAMDGLLNNVKNSLADILTSLIVAVEGIFSLELFYNPKLNANLDETTCKMLLKGEQGSDPLNDLVQAINDIKEASEKFTNNLGDQTLTETIKLVVKLLKSVKDIFVSIGNMAKGVVDKIVELASYLTDENPTSLYDLLLISAYMTHNLPNRTDAGEVTVNIDDGISADIKLENEALTGYSYDDIVRDSDGKTMFKGAELEYILGGSNDEKANQSFSFMEIYMLRFLLNIPVVLTDPDVGAMAGAATIASWVVYLLVMLGEPMVDTVFLVNGEEVFLVKNGCYLSPSGIGSLGEKLIEIASDNEKVQTALNDKWSQIKQDKLPKATSSVDLDKGIFKMDYEIHMLLVIMLSVTEENIMRRFANLVQLESYNYYKEQGASYKFDIKKAYSCIETVTKVEYRSFIDIFQLNGKSLMKKTHTRMKGY